MSNLRTSSFGCSFTTLEDVFLKLADDNVKKVTSITIKKSQKLQKIESPTAIFYQFSNKKKDDCTGIWIILDVSLTFSEHNLKKLSFYPFTPMATRMCLASETKLKFYVIFCALFCKAPVDVG